MALIASTVAGSTTGDNVTSPGIDTTGANLLILSCCLFAAYPDTVSDSYGNTWVGINQTSALGFFGGLSYWYVVNPTVGPGHTFTVTQSTSGRRPAIAVSAWSNAVTLQDYAGAGSVVGTTRETASVAPLAIGELMLSTFGFENTDTVTASSGWTIMGQTPYAVGQHAGIAHAWKLAPSTAGQTATWSWTNAMSSPGCLIASFTVTPDPAATLITPFVSGAYGTVTSSLTALFNLDGETRSIDEPGTFYIGGKLIVTGEATLPNVTVTDPSSLFNRIVTAGGNIVVDSNGNIVFTS